LAVAGDITVGREGVGRGDGGSDHRECLRDGRTGICRGERGAI
jgi:hypothetical protein